MKRVGDGETHWHADLAMAPLDTNALVTCWIPLQPVPAEASGGSGSGSGSGSGYPNPNPNPRVKASVRVRVTLTRSPTLAFTSGLVFAGGSHRDVVLPFWLGLELGPGLEVGLANPTPNPLTPTPTQTLTLTLALALNPKR